MVTRKDYTAEAVEAAYSVLIELMHALGAHRENIVLIGGWVPDFLLGGTVEPHVGSIDVDLALDHRKMKEEGYRTIRELLTSMGYKEGRQPERKRCMGYMLLYQKLPRRNRCIGGGVSSSRWTRAG